MLVPVDIDVVVVAFRGLLLLLLLLHQLPLSVRDQQPLQFRPRLHLKRKVPFNPNLISKHGIQQELFFKYTFKNFLGFSCHLSIYISCLVKTDLCSRSQKLFSSIQSREHDRRNF